jgi:hypothetical protein
MIPPEDKAGLLGVYGESLNRANPTLTTGG